jgi:hypothetical protein
LQWPDPSIPSHVVFPLLLQHGIFSTRPLEQANSIRYRLKKLSKSSDTNVNFGSFTGNDTLIQWFGLLNRFYNVKGKAQVCWKVHGNSKTPGIDSDQAMTNLIDGLRNEKKGYIYHCWNHYFCPIGFEQTPSKAYQAYSQMKDIAELDTWIIIGEVSKCYPVFHVKKWEDVATDISCAFPKYFNIRKTELGI